MPTHDDPTLAPSPPHAGSQPWTDARAPAGYAIERELGRGGMGVVYLARSLALQRPCALKVILSGAHSGDREAERFRTEAQAIARLQHPGIVQVFEIGEHDGRPFMALEYLPGGSLDSVLARNPLAPKDAARLVRSLAEAIHAAHQAKVVHRDLKPANVLLTEKGEPKVTDFGLAKKLDEDGATQTGCVMGTPSYMPPEQAEGKKDVGPPADIYALGAVLYECLVGRPPFRAATALDTLLQALTEEPVPLRQLNAQVAADLETICDKCLQKNPARRYATAQELADDLGRWLAGEPIRARPVGVAERAAKWVRRNAAVSALAAAAVSALVAGAAVSGWFAFQAGEEARTARKAEEKASGEANSARKAEQKASEEAKAARKAEDKAKASARAEAEAKVAAQRGREEAEEQRDFAERLVYAGKLALAQQLWKDGMGPEAIALLEECQWTLRGWEHRHLWAVFTGGQRTLRGHQSSVIGVAWDRGGKRLFSIGHDCTVRIWDAAKGRETAALKRPGEVLVKCIALSADGNLIACGNGDATVTVWDVAKGQAVRTFNVHTKELQSVAWSPDGKRILTGGGAFNEPGEMKVWNAETGLELHALKGHTDHITSVAFSPGGKRIVSGSNDNTARVWDAQTGKELLSLKGHAYGIASVAFSPDGTRILTGSHDNTAKVWNAETGRELLSLAGHIGYLGRSRSVNSVAWGPDGTRILTGGGDATARVWDASTGKPILVLMGHRGPVDSVAWSPDGKRVLSGSYDQTVKVWDAEPTQGPLSLTGHAEAVNRVAWSTDGKRLASLSSDTVKVWDTDKGQEVLDRKGLAALVGAWSPDGKWLVSGSADGTIKVWDAETGKERRLLKGHMGAVLGVAWSPDGKRVLSGGLGGNSLIEPGVAKIWNAEKGKMLHTLEGHKQGVFAVAWRPDGKHVLTGGVGGEVKVWDARTGREAFPVRHHQMTVYSVAYSPNGKLFLSGSHDTTIKIRDAANGQELRALAGHVAPVRAAIWSPDGKRIVSAGSDTTLKVWDAEKGLELLTLRGHADEVRGLAWSRDGKRIASGGLDRTVKVWETGHETCSLAFRGWQTQAMAHEWSPNGQRIFSAQADGILKVWDWENGRTVLTLRGRQASVTCAKWSPDGKRLLTGSGGNDSSGKAYPGEIKVWDAENGKMLLALKGHTSGVEALAWTLDGTRVSSTDSEGKKLGWNVATGQPVPAHDLPQPLANWAENHPQKDLRLTWGDGVRVEPLARLGLPSDKDPILAPDLPGWHRKKALEAERQKQHFAAAFHLGRLLLDSPGDPALLKRRVAALAAHAGK